MEWICSGLVDCCAWLMMLDLTAASGGGPRLANSSHPEPRNCDSANNCHARDWAIRSGCSVWIWSSRRCSLEVTQNVRYHAYPAGVQ